MLQQSERVQNDFVNVHFHELGPAGPEKFSRLLTISEARKVCRVIFSDQGTFLRVALQLL